jgi:hypothetical protein
MHQRQASGVLRLLHASSLLSSQQQPLATAVLHPRQQLPPMATTAAADLSRQQRPKRCKVVLSPATTAPFSQSNAPNQQLASAERPASMGRGSEHMELSTSRGEQQSFSPGGYPSPCSPGSPGGMRHQVQRGQTRALHPVAWRGITTPEEKAATWKLISDTNLAGRPLQPKDFVT